MEPFTDAAQNPDDGLVKEVYAHFGLCMYMAQVFETGLINILTALETRASKRSTRSTFDTLYTKHEALTFGNLMRALEKHMFLPVDLVGDVRRLKAARDHLAHRFFREHALDFMTIAGCYVMIGRLEEWCGEFEQLDTRVGALVVPALGQLGFDVELHKKHEDEEISRMLEEARRRYSSII